MVKVLLLDCRNGRREKLASMLVRYGNVRVDSKEQLTRDQYEAGEYDVAVVHYGNVEGPHIEDGWSAPNTRVILFSGNFGQSLAETDGVLYVSARFVEQEDNFRMLLDKVLSK